MTWIITFSCKKYIRPAALQSGKAPGPDGFPIEFYKKFFLLNYLHSCSICFEHFLSQGTLPKSLTEALITLLLKPEKDPTQYVAHIDQFLCQMLTSIF